MLSTIHHHYTSTTANKSSPMRPLADKNYEYLWKGDFLRYRKEVFEAHNEEVRRGVRGKGMELLGYRVGEGWERLCAFLRVDVPEEIKFPRVDDWVDGV